MDYEFEDPADAAAEEDAMEVDQQQEGAEEGDDVMMEDEDIPVTQEDAWAVIR